MNAVNKVNGVFKTDLMFYKKKKKSITKFKIVNVVGKMQFYYFAWEYRKYKRILINNEQNLLI